MCVTQFAESPDLNRLNVGAPVDTLRFTGCYARKKFNINLFRTTSSLHVLHKLNEMRGIQIIGFRL